MGNKTGTQTQHEINADCAVSFNTLNLQMKQTTEALAWINEKLNGNGKAGLIKQSDINREDIAELREAIREVNEARRKEIETRQAETRERKNDSRKWWLSQASGLVTTVLAVAQTIIIALVLAK